MEYLVPAWHGLLNDWAVTIPMVEFDDAVNHLQILRDDQQKAGLIVTDYQPQLTTKLNQFSITPMNVLSVFDYLQNIHHLDSRVVNYRDLNWPADSIIDNTSFRTFIVSKGRLYARVVFDTQGKVLWIDYYQKDGQESRRLLLDSRGFVSREEHYQNGQPAYFDYLDEQGHWRIRHNKQTDEVDVNPDQPQFTVQKHYLHLTDLLNEVVEKRFLPTLKKTDRLIISVDDGQKVSIASFLQHPGTVLSFSHWHPYEKTLQALSKGKLNTIVADSAATAEYVKEIGQLTEVPSVIPVFQSQFKLGHSQRSFQQRIAVFCENTSSDQLRQIIEMIYQILLKDSKGLAVDYLMYTPQKEQEVRSLINEMAKQHDGEFEFKPEKPDQNENDADLLKKEIPQLDIKVYRMASSSDVLKILDKSRIMVDYGQRIDDFMEIAVISVGIPQIRKAPTELLKDGDNGIVIDSINELPEKLGYYLDSLKHWNEALANNVKFLNQYSEDNLLKKWQAVLGKGETTKNESPTIRKQ